MLKSPEFVHLLRKMGHDMRVPLNTLISTSDMLSQGVYDSLTPKQTRAVERLQRNSHRLLGILDDFVTYLRADTDDLITNPQPFDPRAQLEEWCQSIQPFIEGKELSFHLHSSEQVPSQLIGDSVLIERMVQALLWNAVDHTAQGGIEVCSEWTPTREWCITVQDSGVGIPEQNLPHIFEPFWRGEIRSQLPVPGAGLGLPMSLAIARCLGGTLALRQTSPQGSTFYIQIRLEQIDVSSVE
jgi:signal transduction histidine kinase